MGKTVLRAFAPPPPRRRRKGVRNVDTATRLRIYENALRKPGIDPESLFKDGALDNNSIVDQAGVNGNAHSRRTVTPPDNSNANEIGVLVTEHGKSRYLENGIWTSLRSEFRDLKEILDENSDEESSDGRASVAPAAFSSDGSRLLFGSPASSTGQRSLHPQPVEAFKLWQTYLDNINPLIKLFHAPTVQQLISEANGNLDNVPRNVEALLFAIYSISVESLSDGECVAITGEPKDTARQRFRSGAQHALINASFLKTSDLMVLQALTLFILSLQNIDARIIWMLSGIAQRIGQRIGIHRDGDMLKLPAFDAEIRRRLWWQIIMMEGFSQKLAGTGTGTNAAALMGDVKMPANLNDSDLFPVWNGLTTTAVNVTVKKKAIEELEHLFEHKFLRYCDPSIAWHLMCTHLAKAIIFMMRFMAYGANCHSPGTTAFQVCSSQNLAYTMKEMQGFMWHVNMHFQWKAFVYMLSELRHRTSSQEVEEAWRAVRLTYEFHPTFDQELSRRALPIAVSNLALKAWEAYVAANGIPSGGEPYFVQLLRGRQRRSKKSTGQTDTCANTTTSSSTPGLVP
ncbi:hypothetical protein EJ07DRAFT_158705 [Lizonia empirigonia]|nr:hypothetical protein EJ07DRAFT_158705 [Lizonia empirigonia]